MRILRKDWIATCAALLGTSWMAYSQSPRTGGSPVAITEVTVIDVLTGARHPGTTVLLQGDRITAVGPKIAIPRGASRVNGKGKFLIPGLWDMHSHHQGNGAESVDLFVATGVVGTRDMGSDADFILPLRERINAGVVLGPEIFASGPMLDDAPPSYPYRLTIRNAQEARDAVHELKRLGVDFLKVHDHTPREVFFAVADEAPKVGLTFAGHVPINVTVEEAINSGMASIEHLANNRVWDDCSTDTYRASDCAPVFDKLAAKGIWQTPTLAFFKMVPDVFAGAPVPHAEFASDSLLEAMHHNVESSKLDAATLEKLRLAHTISLQAVHDMQLRGVRFLAGCDAIVPGFCLHDELELFTKAGFSPLEALQTATINPARFLHREASQGTIETGKRADLVLLNADPLLDIRNTSAIATVVIRGKIVDKPTIDRIIARHRRKIVK